MAMPLVRKSHDVSWTDLKIQDDQVDKLGKEVEVLNVEVNKENHVSNDDESKSKDAVSAKDTDWEPIAMTREPIGIQMMRCQGLITDEEEKQEKWIDDPDEVVFEVNGVQLTASKQLLVAASHYFKSTLTDGPNRIFVDDYEFEVVQELINWIENENYDPNPTIELLELSYHYQVKPLFHVVENKMMHKMNTLNVHGCLKFFAQCDEIKACQLKQLTMKFILRNWKDVVQTAPEFKIFTQQEPELLVDLLNMATDCINMHTLNVYL